VSERSSKAILPLLVLAVLAFGAWSFFDTFSNVGYTPKQPIAFSHKLHAGTRKIPCLYCHSNAERSRHATVPAMNVCMNCHIVARTDRPAIQEITKLYQENKPVEWVRIHRLPDYVYFSHRWHVAKGFACQKCHGEVQTMDEVTQVAPLKMGWCISCHRQNQAPTECNTCHM
jgi:Cytochrome c7 and related cytochrome c